MERGLIPDHEPIGVVAARDTDPRAMAVRTPEHQVARQIDMDATQLFRFFSPAFGPIQRLEDIYQRDHRRSDIYLNGESTPETAAQIGCVRFALPKKIWRPRNAYAMRTSAASVAPQRSASSYN